MSDAKAKINPVFAAHGISDTDGGIRTYYVTSYGRKWVRVLELGTCRTFKISMDTYARAQFLDTSRESLTGLLRRAYERLRAYEGGHERAARVKQVLDDMERGGPSLVETVQDVHAGQQGLF